MTLNVGSSQFYATSLPANNFDSNVQGVAFPYWSDLAVYQNTPPQIYGIYYYANSSYAMFEWILTPACCSNQLFQFSLAYDNNNPGVVVYRYVFRISLGESLVAEKLEKRS
jgi:hypothetical protein